MVFINKLTVNGFCSIPTNLARVLLFHINRIHTKKTITIIIITGAIISGYAFISSILGIWLFFSASIVLSDDVGCKKRYILHFSYLISNFLFLLVYLSIFSRIY